MVIFLYGPDTFRARRKLKQLIKKYQAKNKSGLNLAKISLIEKSFDDLKNFFGAVSMFAEKKLAVVQDLFEAAPDIKDKFLEYLNKSDLKKSQEKFLIILAALEKSKDKKNKGQYVFKDKTAECLFKELKAPSSSSEEFDELTDARLGRWIKREIESQGGKIEPAAISQLAGYVGSDLWLMENEIKKLVIWSQAQSEKHILKVQDVDILVRACLESNIFNLIDALGQKDKKRAFQILHQQLEQGERPEVLLSMFVYQFRNLLTVKDLTEKHIHPASMNKILKLHPFVLRKALWQIKNFSFSGLKQIYHKLSELDLALKTGQIDPEAAFDLLVAELE